ncbi:selenium metabolism-associated LysR family transcriptional regulator [uncultured Desulfosarcina sp.]|uniref:selenium metabolism-associated LysR family transcriptional regulator n=1 Tax=uncultured Desulfosarcina sp. TaxID=218289 RepID=UPI0029C86615|nr:selenium metabolism-associated LysR family transcriptional regulator [uncultured Desulfosarcina sp.]
MDLWQLQIFCKVVDLKSFSRAGRAVHLSQPTVSSHIKDLEDHFGCRLIDRLAKEALPTKAGQLLYRYAKKMISLRDETESALAAFKGEIKGCLDIGGSTIPGAFILPAIIGAFTARYPDVNISLSIADTRQIIDGILSGELELGVVGAASSDPGIFQRRLVEDTMCLVVPAGHRWFSKKHLTAKQLFDEPFIIRESGSGTLKSIQNSFAEAGLRFNDLKVVARIGSTEALRQGIKSGMGVSILSAVAVADDVAAGNLQALTIDGLNLKRDFYLTHHRHRSLSPLCQAFIEFIGSRMPE